MTQPTQPLNEQLKPCPFCGETPDATEESTFRLTDGYKWGAVSCCCCGPEVRTGYGEVADWKDAAITAWNTRINEQPSALAGDDLCRFVESWFPGSVAWANDPEQFSHLIELTPEQLCAILSALKTPDPQVAVLREALKTEFARASAKLDAPEGHPDKRQRDFAIGVLWAVQEAIHTRTALNETRHTGGRDA